jgi:hypothetical protein
MAMSAKIALVLFTFVIFWGVGFMMQRSRGRYTLQPYNRGMLKSRWAWLFGFQPGASQFHFRYVFLQVLGWLYLIIGSLVAWCCDQELFNDVTSCTFVIFIGGAIVFGLFDIFGKR